MSAGTRLLSIGSIASATIGGSLLHPVVTGQAGATTNLGDSIGTGLLPASALFVAIALVLGLVAYRRHIPTVDRAISSTTTKRVATLTVTGLVISTAVLGGLGGPASPVETVQAGYFEGCEFSDSLTLAIGTSLGLSEQDCAFYTPDTEQIDQTDAYAGGLALGDDAESFRTTQTNFAQDSVSVAWAKAKIEVINSLNNNESEATALNDSKEVVEDYYLTREKNVIRDWEARAAHMNYLSAQSGTALYTEDDTGSSQGCVNGTEAAYEITSNINASVDYMINSSETDKYNWGAVFGPRMSGNNAYHNASGTIGPVIVYANDTDGTKTEVLSTLRYESLLSNLTSQHTQVTSNLETYVNETYAAYEAGEIDSTDLAASDPTTLATQAATDYNSTGYYGLASAQLAAMGLSGNETVSHVVNTTENGSTRVVTGTLFYTGEDDQSFSTGTQYDPSTLNGSTYMSVASITDGNGTELNNSGGFYYVDEPFTISEATDTRTGEAVSTTAMETRDYSSTNVSKLQQELETLKEQREFYEQQTSAAGGGTGSSNTMLIAVIALAAGAALMWRRDDD